MPPTGTRRSSMMAMTEIVRLRKELYAPVQEVWNKGRVVTEGL